ncbi:hypothetical protein, partial [Bradyrhizobium sp. RT5a]|uniref:hypothetical protein n=1 Tax=unclassified Bradyrhizobium TaxID=2631580 RepID=UPI00339A7BC4
PAETTFNRNHNPDGGGQFFMTQRGQFRMAFDTKVKAPRLGRWCGKLRAAGIGRTISIYGR